MSANNTTNLVGNAGEVLKKNVKDLLATGLFSDLTIVCGHKEFKVHKSILYLQSDYFKKLLGGEFREANSSTIPFDEDPDTFHALIHFLYNFTWCPSMVEPTQVVAVYQLADKYLVPPLYQLAASRFKQACDPKGNTETFIDAIDAVLESTAPGDDTLWNIVFPMIKQNMRLLTKNASFVDLLQKHEDLNIRLLEEMSVSEPAEHTAIDPDLLADGGGWGSIYGGGGRKLG
ncbi:hypothetical protein CLAFUW4_06474 [Fulvia fulva]|uniref:BTB domain-containing protein n=1 Tax=Passalora fulva TaxID=5499 RepID=A0A9Q8P8S9_PASFU|nr:uncharacterized protein CLAFUR5_06618 [Fulvia fulva]KAK4625353.1 hypothetical protein CLAFUR0_06479 [Fulvia fulva]UJO17534.1 hypothetical protein CLAFUR5_06618 [Fulvia fulva]WPV15475.1 hypothetical protein CLAFUW4_06474 [Fulvia fulva]WPV29830.1 hypothetical protein CLAFUW7_06474 [Fulvia fulva]